MWAAEEHPTLLSLAPDKIIRNIDGVVKHFAKDGLTGDQYLDAAKKHPSLFFRKSETIIGHINQVIDMYKKGLLASDNRRQPEKDTSPHDPHDLKPVFDFLMSKPQLMCLSNDNYTLRAIYSANRPTPPSFNILRKPKGKVEDELRKRLGHPDKNIPVQKIHMPKGLYDEHGNAIEKHASYKKISDRHRRSMMKPYAENLLLRALIHEGLLEGELEQNTEQRGRT
jgi:hypothetical protein